MLSTHNSIFLFQTHVWEISFIVNIPLVAVEIIHDVSLKI